MEHLPEIGLAFGAFALGMFSPGPNILSVVGTSMAISRKAGVALALGISAGSLLWASMTAIGLTALIAAYASVLTAIKIVGGLYLLFLAWRSARSAMQAEMPPPKASGSGRRLYLRGYLMHLTNPKAILSWTAIIALGLRPETPAVVLYAIILGCLTISLAINQTYAWLFSTASMVAGYRRIRRRAEACLAAFFTFASFKLLTAQL